MVEIEPVVNVNEEHGRTKYSVMAERKKKNKRLNLATTSLTLATAGQPEKADKSLTDICWRRWRREAKWDTKKEAEARKQSDEQHEKGNERILEQNKNKKEQQEDTEERKNRSKTEWARTLIQAISLRMVLVLALHTVTRIYASRRVSYQISSASGKIRLRPQAKEGGTGGEEREGVKREERRKG
jgi:hypothetical protein